MTYHLTVSDLKFVDTEHWVHIDIKENVAVGAVCCLAQDRVPEWNLFVIVDGIDLEKGDAEQKYKIIFPRIRMIDGELFLGQDKAFEMEEEDDGEGHDDKCQLCNIQQGCCFSCTCGYGEKCAKKYAETFVPSKEGTYKMFDFHCKSYYDDYDIIERVQIRNVNQLDEPILFHCIEPKPDLSGRSKREIIPEHLNHENLKKLVEKNRISLGTLCEFVHLKNGEWRYSLKLGKKTHYISGQFVDCAIVTGIILNRFESVIKLVMMKAPFGTDIKY